jgi:3-deoxy-D-arabino-heptulosonate 7-phosphate (DAHP) synthase
VTEQANAGVRAVSITDDVVLGRGPLVLIAGPCVIESDAHALELGSAIRDIAKRAGVSYVFKASFDKANRTSLSSFRGPGIEAGLNALGSVSSCSPTPTTRARRPPPPGSPTSCRFRHFSRGRRTSSSRRRGPDVP